MRPPRHVFVGQPPGSLFNETTHDPDVLAEAYGTIPDPDVVKTAAYVSQWETAILIVSSSDAIADCPSRLASLRLQSRPADARAALRRHHAAHASRPPR